MMGIKTLRIVTIFTGILFLLLLSAGCGKEPGSTKNLKKVTLRIHAWNGYVNEYIEDFKKYARDQHNLDVRIEVSFTTGLASFIENIRGKTKAHIISPANDLLAPLLQKKLLISLERGKLKNFKQINPIILQTKAHMIDSRIFAVPFNFGPYGLAYNKDKMKKPKSYKILWNPKYRKRVSIPGEYYTMNIYMTALMLGYPKKDIFSLSDSQLARIESKLRYLCKNQVGEFWQDNLNPASFRKVDVGTDWGIGVKKINKEFSGNWGYVIPEEGATGWIDTWAATININDTDVEKAAYAWLNFMISPEVQAQMARVTSYAPVNPYAGRYFSAEEKKEYYLIDSKFMEKIILWQPLRADILKKYQETWKRAKN